MRVSLISQYKCLLYRSASAYYIAVRVPITSQCECLLHRSASASHIAVRVPLTPQCECLSHRSANASHITVHVSLSILLYFSSSPLSRQRSSSGDRHHQDLGSQAQSIHIQTRQTETQTPQLNKRGFVSQILDQPQ